MKRVVVLGLMGQYPMGGMAWQVLHHVIGFRRLGCECFYIEDSGAPPYSPRLGSVAREARENVRFVDRTFRSLGLEHAWAYYDGISERWLGMDRARVRELMQHADLVVNLCGASRPEPGARREGCLAYVETDPVCEQVKLAAGDAGSRAFVEAHDVCFTYGINIGEAGCPIPSGDVPWRRTRPPVVVDLWESPPHPRGSWRTVATARNSGKDVVLDGERYYWSKHPSFERMIDFPARTQERLEIALHCGSERERELFRAHGWRLRDPYRVSRSAGRYRRYLQGAKGEFSVEKDSYVRLCSGWFSDRSVCMLAAGRPCVVEDTGFGWQFPTEEGLLAWSKPEEAVACLERVAADYARHARAARAVAEEVFEARVVLPDLLDAAGL